LNTLAYINLFSDDIDQLAAFYSGLFELTEIEASRSPYFRGFRAGGCSLGFSTRSAYPILGLQDGLNTAGIKSMLTFDVSSRDEVTRMTEKAITAGATLIKAPYETYFGWFQSVLADPQGNAFRVNCST
jgi:predicted enzyme related to lactoylglutathione lyase